MKKLIILTSSFPYQGGEQFIESEISYWENTEFDKIILLPANCNGYMRDTPKNINVIRNNISKFTKFGFVLLALFSSLFYKEIIYIIKNEKREGFLQKIPIALIAVANTLLQKFRISKELLSDDEFYIYSYWNDVSVYASCLLKREKKVKKIFSRVHGFDIYQERRAYNYMPLKREFIKDMDKVYCLSQNAIEYYIHTYNISTDKLTIGRLGVIVPNNIDKNKYIEDKLKIRILSLSYCVPVKRIDKIIKSLEVFAHKYPSISIEWTHIGSGILFEQLYSMAMEVEKSVSNFKSYFLGGKTNSEVIKVLKEQTFDLFINTSESEGIPVSIMEAMSYGIPTIAPNIGGIADLVRTDNGFLISEQAKIEEIVDALVLFFNSEEKWKLRYNSWLWVKQNFNSVINYSKFIKELEELSL